VSNDKQVEISELKFDTDGLTLGVGTSNGNCILYDIRSSKPIYTKEHQYEVPIVNITFHNSSRHVVSTDKKIVKIWERDGGNQGKILTNIETPADINDIHIIEDKRGESGLIMIAGELSRVMTFFVPRLGPAPRWCSFLENLTEELEETSGQTVYEDFKFVTSSEVEDIGASGLIGTPMLRAYMHGYFMEMKLYNKLRAVSKPFEYEEYRKKKIKDKVSTIIIAIIITIIIIIITITRLMKRDKVELLFKNDYQKLIKHLHKSSLRIIKQLVMMIILLVVIPLILLIAVSLPYSKEMTLRSILIVMSLN
jgi:ribosome biogenesis protein ENP2